MKYLHWIMALFTGGKMLLISAASAFAQTGPGQGPREDYMHYPWGGMMSWGWLGMAFHVLMLILILIALVLVVKWLLMQSSQSKREDKAIPEQKSRSLEILKERYARGEIDRQEFEQKKQDLD
ncbi:SHOCT domain-containing protein [Desulfonatronospira sp.]|uniref:SHOCT domain-containing protein n=1 Tax=Desulfonatronospira sp. TaxID=1962951 RepID=UPI0025BDF8F4|nr:SHOCT domain-containing protein [Desulfonatronospira sp.]